MTVWRIGFCIGISAWLAVYPYSMTDKHNNTCLRHRMDGDDVCVWKRGEGRGTLCGGGGVNVEQRLRRIVLIFLGAFRCFSLVRPQLH